MAIDDNYPDGRDAELGAPLAHSQRTSETPIGADPDVPAKLAHTLRAIFPHDGLADGPYQRSAQGILDAAAGSARKTGVLHEGVRSLDGLAGGDVRDKDADALAAILRALTQTEFFQTLLTSAVVTLYSDPETWEYLGYEGFSSDKGGYLHRGFDDLDWLPEPRITEYDGPGLPEYTPAIPGTLPDFGTQN